MAKLLETMGLKVAIMAKVDNVGLRGERGGLS
jgi:hypothetical protein